ncbi:hypothetical protein [Rhizobium sp. ZPR3]|uniref:Integrase n=2 Tax=unclassified Rhizobium TaxID=2613769 RepID=A0AAU7SBC4_9HYPH
MSLAIAVFGLSLRVEASLTSLYIDTRSHSFAFCRDTWFVTPSGKYRHWLIEKLV